jgi:hypothetical protein
MLKRSSLLALGFAALAAPWLSVPAAATGPNGTLNGNLNGNLNGTANGNLNGTANGNSSSGVMFDVVTLQAVKLALPDGTELAFR